MQRFIRILLTPWGLILSLSLHLSLMLVLSVTMHSWIFLLLSAGLILLVLAFMAAAPGSGMRGAYGAVGRAFMGLIVLSILSIIYLLVWLPIFIQGAYRLSLEFSGWGLTGLIFKALPLLLIAAMLRLERWIKN